MGSRFKHSKRIVCLQFAPELGKFDANITKAEGILRAWAPDAIDWLILPELAFTGYNFPNLEAISPYLEPTTAGPTTRWAMGAAKRMNCHVTVGYPEICAPDSGRASTTTANSTGVGVKRYNSTVTVSPNGDILLNYRKSFLYYTDESWAHEGPGDTEAPFFHGSLGALGSVSHGICMDINPYRFEADRYAKYEFATAAMAAESPIIALSTAWLTHLNPEELRQIPAQPDPATLYYWIERFTPVIEASEQVAASGTALATREDADGASTARETILVFANRSGTEGEASYAGTSCVLRVRDGKIEVLDVMGRGDEGLLVVDTAQVGKFSIPPDREARKKDMLRMVPEKNASLLALHMGMRDW